MISNEVQLKWHWSQFTSDNSPLVDFLSIAPTHDSKVYRSQSVNVSCWCCTIKNAAVCLCVHAVSQLHRQCCLPLCFHAKNIIGIKLIFNKLDLTSKITLSHLSLLIPSVDSFSERNVGEILKDDSCRLHSLSNNNIFCKKSTQNILI